MRVDGLRCTTVASSRTTNHATVSVSRAAFFSWARDHSDARRPAAPRRLLGMVPLAARPSVRRERALGGARPATRSAAVCKRVVRRTGSAAIEVFAVPPPRAAVARSAVRRGSSAATAVGTRHSAATTTSIASTWRRQDRTEATPWANLKTHFARLRATPWTAAVTSAADQASFAPARRCGRSMRC